MKIECKNKMDWLDVRSTVITATEASSMFAINPYGSVHKMLDQKRNPDFIENAYTRLGHVLEPAIVKAVNMLLDKKFVDPPGIQFYKHEAAALGATPDAIDGPWLLECKSTGPKKFENEWVDSPPIYYILQVHVQMICSGVKKAYIAGMSTDQTPTSFQSPLPLRIFQVHYNKELEKIVLERANYAYSCLTDGTKYVHDRELNTHVKKLLLNSTTGIEV